MAVDLQTILEALASQVHDHLDRDTNVYPNPLDDPKAPAIEIVPGSPLGPFVRWFLTDGPAGLGEINVRARLTVRGDTISRAMKINAYLGIGTGNGSSIFDAIHFDRHLGLTEAVVQDCIALTGDWNGDPDVEPEIPIQIIVKKEGTVV